MKKFIIFGLIAVFISIACRVLFEKYEAWYLKQLAARGGVEYAVKNYKKSVDSLAGIYKLPSDYLMALIMLESSGRKKVPVRFEKGIYDQLKQLQEGKIEKFENLGKSDLKGVKDKTLRALASSYGPFQIMGYKKYILKISLDDLKGNKNMDYAIKWIDFSYGEMLRSNEFRDAFHFHNVGKRYPLEGPPLTHDPNYVENGLNFQKYFKNLANRKNDKRL